MVNYSSCRIPLPVSRPPAEHICVPMHVCAVRPQQIRTAFRTVAKTIGCRLQKAESRDMEATRATEGPRAHEKRIDSPPR